MIGVGTWDRKTTDYGYDQTGNRTSEKLVNDGSKGGVGYNDTLVNETATYDSLGRMLTMAEVGSDSTIPASVTYSYDAAGNIRRSQNFHYNLDQNGYTTTPGGEDNWFTYDVMNRLIIDKGYLNGSVIERGSALIGMTAGKEYRYDAAGQRVAMLRTELRPRIPWGEYYLDGEYYEVRENYDYDGAGRIGTIRTTYGNGTTAIYDSETDSYTPAGPIAGAPNTGGATNSVLGYDLMGRQTGQSDYDGTNVVYSRTSVFAANGTMISYDSTTVRFEADGVTTNSYRTANTYALTDVSGQYLLGAVASVGTDNWKGGTKQASSSTTNSYQWWDGALQGTVLYKPDTSQSTTYDTTFTYDDRGTLMSTKINDGRPRTVTFRTNADGQVIQRHEEDGNYNPLSGGDPHEYWYRFGGRELGFVGNNGSNDMNTPESIVDRRAYQGNFAFHNGLKVTSDFAQSGNAINSYAQGSSAGGYVVQSSGETLRSIASQLWGDASLWYKIAEANGLQGDVGLIEGQRLNLPAGISRTHHNAATLQPYDANEAIGNLSPTTPKPPKKNKCGAFGQVLLMVVAVAVTAIALPAGAPTVIQGALAGFAGSAASQAVGLATGIQQKFDFKGLALATIAGGVSGGLGNFDGVSKGVDKFLNNNGLIGNTIRGAAGSTITQGIGVATGLQSKFSFAGVAAAGIASGLSGELGKALKLDPLVSTATQKGIQSFENIAGHAFANTVTGIASAATRSVIEGSSFGDNLIRALPDVIAQTIGNAVAGAVSHRQGSSITGGKPWLLSDELAARGYPKITQRRAWEAEFAQQEDGYVQVGGPVEKQATMHPQYGSVLDFDGNGRLNWGDLPAGMGAVVNWASNRVEAAGEFLTDFQQSIIVQGQHIRSAIPDITRSVVSVLGRIGEAQIAEGQAYDLRPALRAYSNWASKDAIGPTVRNFAIVTDPFVSAPIAQNSDFFMMRAPTSRGELVDAGLMLGGLLTEGLSAVVATSRLSRVAGAADRAAIGAARADQLRWGYAADEWGMTRLTAGDRVFGGLPGQSAYYTDAGTLAASGGSRTSLFESLQVKAHPEFGYRPMVGEYEVLGDMHIPFGTARANPNFGAGGGNQFFIENYADRLRLVREHPLGQ